MDESCLDDLGLMDSRRRSGWSRHDHALVVVLVLLLWWLRLYLLMMVAAVAVLVSRRRRALLLINGAAVQVDADVDLAIGALGSRGGSGRVCGGGDVHWITLGGRRHLDGRCHNWDCPRAH